MKELLLKNQPIGTVIFNYITRVTKPQIFFNTALYRNH